MATHSSVLAWRIPGMGEPGGTWLKWLSSSSSILSCPFLLLPSIFPSIRIFSSELALHIRWPRYWSFSLSISPSNEYSGLISFRIDWFDLLFVWGTLKNLLQHHNLKASILWCLTFFLVLHDYWKKHSFDYMDLCQQSVHAQSLQSFFLELLVVAHWSSSAACWTPSVLGGSPSVVILLAFSYGSWGSRSMNTEVVCHSLP